MKEIAIMSGKGGTGKTSLCSSLISIAQDQRILLCDCDVECPDLHLLIESGKVIETGCQYALKAQIDFQECLQCNLCVNYCQFNAIHDYVVSADECEGCGLCQYLCPVEAVSMKERIYGWWFQVETAYGPMLRARLDIGEQNSGKMVALLRNNAREIAARENCDFILNDGPPGSGCPAIAATSNCDLAIIVTEPGCSAIHDLKRIVELCRHFKIPCGVVINKCDLNEKCREEIKQYCSTEGIALFGEIPFRMAYPEAIANRQIPSEYNGEIAKEVLNIWQAIRMALMPN